MNRTDNQTVWSVKQCAATPRETTTKLHHKKNNNNGIERRRREWENEIEGGMTALRKTDCCTARLCVSFLRLKKRQINSRLVFGSNTCVISAPPAAVAANGLWIEVEVLLLSSAPLKRYCSWWISSQIYRIDAKCNRALEFKQQNTLTQGVPEGCLWCVHLKEIKITQVASNLS